MRVCRLGMYSIPILMVLAIASNLMVVGVAEGRLTEDDIEALRQQGEREGWTFNVSLNPATEYDLDQLCGMKVPDDWWVGARIDSFPPRKDLPSRFDWRDSSGTTPVRNQGGCGSCWAFATVGALECNIKIKSGISEDLSEQWLVSCNRDGWDCGGGWFAHDYHERKTDRCGGTGAVLETYFPYTATNAPCNCPYPHDYLIDDWAFIGGATPPVSSIKQAIMDYGPVSCCVYVNSAFQGYSGGIFNGCQNGGCNHAICLVGWDDDQGDNGVWFLRNSWGSGWGEGGYMRIPYGCSIVGDYACYVDYRGDPQIILSYPRGGEILIDAIIITWTATDPDPGQTALLDIDLEYSPDAGATWVVIDSNQTNDGSYDWDISSFPEGYKYLISVTATDLSEVSVSDTTDTPFTISKLLPEPVWEVGSDQVDGWAGWSVSGVGDVDGDGYGDVLVGVPGYSNGQDYEGRAYLYAGGLGGLSGSAVWVAENDAAYSYFGNSVDWAGDVNGDGYSDVVVGSQGYSNGQSEEGAAYVYLGGELGLSGEPDWFVESDHVGAAYGLSVSGAGDVDGDGYGDVMVGSPYEDVSGYDEGRAYVYLGGAGGLSVVAGWVGAGEQNAESYGYSVSGVGDVNGDGYGDVLVGSPGYDAGPVEAGAGKVSLYLGAVTGLSALADWEVAGDDQDQRLGYSVSGAGDVNGDGYSDVLVGAPGYTLAETGEGGVFLYLGGSGGLSLEPSWVGYGGQVGAEYGYSVSGAGDVNGDGYGDVVIGAEAYDDGEIDEGRAFLYLGSDVEPHLFPAWWVERNQAEAYFGSCVSGAGDVDGDGYGDIVMGAYLSDDPEQDEGQAYLISGGSVPGMLAFRPRQVQPDGFHLIGPLGASESGSQLRLQVTGWYPEASGYVKLQWEVKPLGVPFDSTGFGEGAGWVLADSVYGVELDELVGGLASDAPYHWRARVLYQPGNPLGLDHSLWLSPAHNGWQETDFRTSGGGVSPPDAIDDLAATLLDGSKSSGGDILLAWTEPYSEGGVQYYVIYRSTLPAQMGDSLGYSVGTEYTDADAAGDPVSNHYYTVRVVDIEGRKSAFSNQVGEFDRQLILPAGASSPKSLPGVE